jgi:methylmalonyl-CoA/ethylmalonyl-CoA epimerase
MRKFLEKNKIPYFRQTTYTEAWKEIFIHPKDAFGVLLQIAEFNPNDWLVNSSKISEDKKWTVSRNNDEYNLTFAHPGGGSIKLKMQKEEINKLINDLKNLVD